MPVVVLWLTVCAGMDVRTRRVPNVWTVSALLVTFVLRLAGMLPKVAGASMFVLGMLFLGAWYAGWLGGADVKALLALDIVHPLLAVCALLGAGLVSVLVLVYRRRATATPAFVGFAVGVGGLWFAQGLSLFPIHFLSLSWR